VEPQPGGEHRAWPGDAHVDPATGEVTDAIDRAPLIVPVVST
jgi:hypothetical protein